LASSATNPERGSGVVRQALRLTVVVLGVIVACWIGARFAHADTVATSSVVGNSVIGSSADSSGLAADVDAVDPTDGLAASVLKPATSLATAATPIARQLPTITSDITSAVGTVTGTLTNTLVGTPAGHHPAPVGAAPVASTGSISAAHTSASVSGPTRDAAFASVMPRHVGSRMTPVSASALRLSDGGQRPAAPSAPGNGGPVLDGGSISAGAGAHGRRLVSEGPADCWGAARQVFGAFSEQHLTATFWLATRTSRPD
jgi:hypothetical protein